MDKRREVARITFQLLETPFPWEEMSTEFQDGFARSPVVNQIMAVFDAKDEN